MKLEAKSSDKLLNIYHFFRIQLLAASYSLHKFYHDSEETLARISEKRKQIPEEMGGDCLSVEDYQRKHEIFTQDIQAIGSQVEDMYFENVLGTQCMGCVLYMGAVSAIWTS